jgi:hypothetical protein
MWALKKIHGAIEVLKRSYWIRYLWAIVQVCSTWPIQSSLQEHQRVQRDVCSYGWDFLTEKQRAVLLLERKFTNPERICAKGIKVPVSIGFFTF